MKSTSLAAIAGFGALVLGAAIVIVLGFALGVLLALMF